MGSGSQEVFKTKLVLPGIWFACRSQKGNLNLEYKIHDTENQERDISWILLNIYGGALLQKYSAKVQIILEIHTSTWIITCMIQRECPTASRSYPMNLYIIVFDLQRNHMKISYWCGLYK